MKAPPMSEAAWQSRVVDYARLMGFRVYHPPDNRPDEHGRKQNVEAGFPDLVMVRGSRLLFAELKKEAEQPTKEQCGWLAALAATGAETRVWWPSEWEAVKSDLKREWS